MPTFWIAVLAAVLALGVAGWAGVRGRTGRAGDRPPPPDASPAEAGGGQDPDWSGDAAQDPGQAGGSVQCTDLAAPEAEQVILQRLCMHAIEAAAPDGPGATRRQDAPAALAEAAAVETLAGIRAHPRYTPRRPHLLPQLSRAINDPGSDAHSIAAILAQDPALAGNLLRIANSAV